MASSKADRAASAPAPWRRMLQWLGLIAFTLAAWLLDTMLPYGFSGNLLYVLPIVTAGALGLGRPYLWAAATTLLAAVTSLLAPRGLSLPLEIGDRLLTIGVLWITAILVCRLQQQRSDAQTARNEAETADVQKTRFLAAASHDLRQPAQSLMLLPAVLRTKAAGTRLEEVVEPLESAITALNSMLTGLLELSRLDAGNVRARPVDVEVPKLLARINNEYALLANSQGLRFRLRCPTHGAFPTDPEFLERILRNLLDNAFKYTRSGFVALICFRRGPDLVIQVCDSGQGIAAEHLDTVFHEFVRIGDPEGEKTHGLGIGLSLVQRSVRMLGGTIRVWSRLGRGSRFTVTLPPMTLPRSAAPPHDADASSLVGARLRPR